MALVTENFEIKLDLSWNYSKNKTSFNSLFFLKKKQAYTWMVSDPVSFCHLLNQRCHSCYCNGWHPVHLRIDEFFLHVKRSETCISVSDKKEEITVKYMNCHDITAYIGIVFNVSNTTLMMKKCSDDYLMAWLNPFEDLHSLRENLYEVVELDSSLI